MVYEETEIRLKLNDMDETTEDVVDLMEFGVGKLSNLADAFQEIDDPEIRFRFQKWLFPAGLMYDGEKFGTTKLPTILQIKRTALAGVSCSNSHCGDPEGRAQFFQNCFPQGVASENPKCKHFSVFTRLLLRRTLRVLLSLRKSPHRNKK